MNPEPIFITVVERPTRAGSRPIEVVTTFERWFLLPWAGSDPVWQEQARAALEVVHHARCIYKAQTRSVRKQAYLLLMIGEGHSHPDSFNTPALDRPAAVAKLANDMFWAVREAIKDRAEGRI